MHEDTKQFLSCNHLRREKRSHAADTRAAVCLTSRHQRNGQKVETRVTASRGEEAS